VSEPTGPTAPQARAWAEVIEALHLLANTVTARSHYAEGHPAIARADEVATALFGRLLERMPEVIVALIDGEFVVCERPMPDLRERIPVLAEAMLRHGVECVVVQRGITTAECAAAGRILASAPLVEGQSHEQARAMLTHIAFRFAEQRYKGHHDRASHETHDFSQVVHALLHEVARSIAAKALVDCARVRSVAESVVASSVRRSFLLEQRCHVDGSADFAGHAANVALMTAAMALGAGLARGDCVELTAAALLHDIGELFLPDAVRGVPVPLLDEHGKSIFRHHPYLGASALLSAGCPLLWVSAALEHHRGVDGKGYPALPSRAIPHEWVRIVSLASYVDRKRTLVRGAADDAEAALHHAAALKDAYFGVPVLGHYVRGLGVFPPGATVQLSDGRAALVVAANPGDPRRPVVRILSASASDERADLKQLDAAGGRYVLSIVKAIPPPLLVRAPEG
jgi:HD-GYP domain-containing protein (c-di-GMP phosphodiesterase class II)